MGPVTNMNTPPNLRSLLAMHCLLYEACDEAVSVHHSKLLYDNHETCNNNVKCLMRTTRNRVHMLSLYACIVRHRCSCSGTPQALRWTSPSERVSSPWQTKAPAVVRRGLIVIDCVVLVCLDSLSVTV